MKPPREKRQYQRAAIPWPISIETRYGPVEKTIGNISGAGVFVSSRRPEGLGKTFAVAIHIPHLDKPLTAVAQLAWSRIYTAVEEIAPRGMGIRFVDIADDDRKVLDTLVSQYLKMEKVKVGKDSLPSHDRIVLNGEENNN